MIRKRTEEKMSFSVYLHHVGTNTIRVRGYLVCFFGRKVYITGHTWKHGRTSIVVVIVVIGVVGVVIVVVHVIVEVRSIGVRVGVIGWINIVWI